MFRLTKKKQKPVTDYGLDLSMVPLLYLLIIIALCFFLGNISTNDVRKTINYYNMLFDADINLEKINSALDKYSQNDYVDVKIIIDSLGNGAI